MLDYITLRNFGTVRPICTKIASKVGQDSKEKSRESAVRGKKICETSRGGGLPGLIRVNAHVTHVATCHDFNFNDFLMKARARLCNMKGLEGTCLKISLTFNNLIWSWNYYISYVTLNPQRMKLNWMLLLWTCLPIYEFEWSKWDQTQLETNLNDHYRKWVLTN